MLKRRMLPMAAANAPLIVDIPTDRVGKPLWCMGCKRVSQPNARFGTRQPENGVLDASWKPQSRPNHAAGTLATQVGTW